MTKVDIRREGKRASEPDLREAAAQLMAEAETIKEGGGLEAVNRQHAKGRMTARERIAALVDPDEAFLAWSSTENLEERVDGLARVDPVVLEELRRA